MLGSPNIGKEADAFRSLVSIIQTCRQIEEFGCILYENYIANGRCNT